MKKTSVANAASLVCHFWHHPTQLNGIVYKANVLFLETGISSI